jgi:hypothetical protein
MRKIDKMKTLPKAMKPNTLKNVDGVKQQKDNGKSAPFQYLGHASLMDLRAI